MGLQVILLKTQGSLLIKKSIAILYMEYSYNFMDKFLINKLLIPRGDMVGLVPEEAFGGWKNHILRQISKPGGL